MTEAERRAERAAIWQAAIDIAKYAGAPPDSAYYTGDRLRVLIYNEAADRIVAKLEAARDADTAA